MEPAVCVPGIIASYRYRMAVFILLDNPECGALQAIRMSKDMMKGIKWTCLSLTCPSPTGLCPLS